MLMPMLMRRPLYAMYPSCLGYAGIPEETGLGQMRNRTRCYTQPGPFRALPLYIPRIFAAQRGTQHAWRIGEKHVQSRGAWYRRTVQLAEVCRERFRRDCVPIFGELAKFRRYSRERAC